jgi:hypothetical protein
VVAAGADEAAAVPLLAAAVLAAAVLPLVGVVLPQAARRLAMPAPVSRPTTRRRVHSRTGSPDSGSGGIEAHIANSFPSKSEKGIFTMLARTGPSFRYNNVGSDAGCRGVNVRWRGALSESPR